MQCKTQPTTLWAGAPTVLITPGPLPISTPLLSARPVRLHVQSLQIQHIDHPVDCKLARPTAHVVDGVGQGRQLAVHDFTDVGGKDVQQLRVELEAWQTMGCAPLTHVCWGVVLVDNVSHVYRQTRGQIRAAVVRLRHETEVARIVMHHNLKVLIFSCSGRQETIALAERLCPDDIVDVNDNS